MVTDPPYGTKKTAWDHSIDEAIFSECLRVSRGYCLFYYSNTRLWHILGIFHRLGVDTWTMVWHKPNAVGFERRFAPQWVPVVCAYRGNLPFWGKDYCNSPIKVQDVKHPTPKQARATEWLVERACKVGGLILDPFMGSGTTGIACVKTGRDFIGIELNPDYFNEAESRIAKAQEQAASALYPSVA